MFKIINTKVINKIPVVSIVDTDDYSVEDISVSELRDFLYKGMIIDGATLLPNYGLEIHIQSPAIPDNVYLFLKNNLSVAKFRQLIILLWEAERLGCNLIKYENSLLSAGGISLYMKQTLINSISDTNIINNILNECNSILMEE